MHVWVNSATAATVWIETQTGAAAWMNATNSATATSNWISTMGNCTTTSTSSFYDAQTQLIQISSQQQAMQMMLAQQANGLANSQYQNDLGRRYDPSRRMSAAELAERAEVNARAELERRERAEEEAKKRKSARARARELLLDHLTDAQRETFEKNHWFVVEGGRSKRRYRIDTARGTSGNVERLVGETAHADERLCIHHRPGGEPIPDYDQFLAQKLMIEGDEDSFRKIANRSRVG